MTIMAGSMKTESPCGYRTGSAEAAAVSALSL
jgi:hypothetical protein